MKRLRILTLVALAILMALHGCQKDLELNNIPSVTDKVEVGTTFATITGTIECAVATKKLGCRYISRLRPTTILPMP